MIYVFILEGHKGVNIKITYSFVCRVWWHNLTQTFPAQSHHIATTGNTYVERNFIRPLNSRHCSNTYKHACYKQTHLPATKCTISCYWIYVCIAATDINLFIFTLYCSFLLFQNNSIDQLIIYKHLLALFHVQPLLSSSIKPVRWLNLWEQPVEDGQPHSKVNRVPYQWCKAWFEHHRDH